jgi:branched-chain amino acid aminotransferase
VASVKCDAVKEYLVLDGVPYPVDRADIFTRIGENSIYEVIKLVDGIPLFFEDHLERLHRSAALCGEIIHKSASAIEAEIRQLVAINHCASINAKLVWFRLENRPRFLTYLVAQDLPAAAAYQRGAHTILYGGERENPQVKSVKTSYRERVRGLREAAGAFEALLVDENGYIFEGTRSNLFFIRHDALLTPPAGAVLLGVTRRHVLAVCRQMDIEVAEAPLHREDLPNLEAAFLTATSIDVLPIGSIESIRLPSADHPLVKRVSQAFAAEAANYLRGKT